MDASGSPAAIASGAISKPTPLAKSCMACRVSKLKCNVPEGESACARCERLGLHCIFQESKRGRPNKNRDIVRLGPKVSALLKKPNEAIPHSLNPYVDSSVSPVETDAVSESGSTHSGDALRVGGGSGGAEDGGGALEGLKRALQLVGDTAQRLLGHSTSSHGQRAFVDQVLRRNQQELDAVQRWGRDDAPSGPPTTACGGIRCACAVPASIAAATAIAPSSTLRSAPARPAPMQVAREDDWADFCSDDVLAVLSTLEEGSSKTLVQQAPATTTSASAMAVDAVAVRQPPTPCSASGVATAVPLPANIPTVTATEQHPCMSPPVTQAAMFRMYPVRSPPGVPLPYQVASVGAEQARGGQPARMLPTTDVLPRWPTSAPPSPPEKTFPEGRGAATMPKGTQRTLFSETRLPLLLQIPLMVALSAVAVQFHNAGSAGFTGVVAVAFFGSVFAMLGCVLWRRSGFSDDAVGLWLAILLCFPIFNAGMDALMDPHDLAHIVHRYSESLAMSGLITSVFGVVGVLHSTLPRSLLWRVTALAASCALALLASAFVSEVRLGDVTILTAHYLLRFITPSIAGFVVAGMCTHVATRIV